MHGCAFNLTRSSITLFPASISSSNQWLSSIHSPTVTEFHLLSFSIPTKPLPLSLGFLGVNNQFCSSKTSRSTVSFNPSDLCPPLHLSTSFLNVSPLFQVSLAAKSFPLIPTCDPFQQQMTRSGADFVKFAQSLVKLHLRDIRIQPQITPTRCHNGMVVLMDGSLMSPFEEEKGGQHDCEVP